MPIFAGNGSIEGGSSAFRIKNASDTAVFEQGVAAYGANSFSYYLNDQRPGFVAVGVQATALYVVISATTTWGKMSTFCTDTVYNKGSGYSTVNTRFTAPITGPYMMIYTAYTYSDGYTHPMFYINGGVTGGGRLNGIYRIRSYGMVANYNQDHQISEILYLTAGDYVEPYSYSYGNCYHWPRYGLFQGVFVG